MEALQHVETSLVASPCHLFQLFQLLLFQFKTLWSLLFGERRISETTFRIVYLVYQISQPTLAKEGLGINIRL